MRKILAVVLAVLLVLSLAGCKKEKEASSEPKDIKVIVVYKDGTEKTFSYTSSERYLGDVLQKAGLVKGNEGPYGLEMTHVDGVQAIYDQDKAYWAFYEGEEYALQGISSTELKDGATYKLVYTPA